MLHGTFVINASVGKKIETIFSYPAAIILQSLHSVQKLKDTPNVLPLFSSQVFIIEQFRWSIGDLKTVPYAPLIKLTPDALLEGYWRNLDTIFFHNIINLAGDKEE